MIDELYASSQPFRVDNNTESSSTVGKKRVLKLILPASEGFFGYYG